MKTCTTPSARSLFAAVTFLMLFFLVMPLCVWPATPAYNGNAVAAGPAITSFSPGFGPVGTLVTIQGTGLTGATSVSVGGAAALLVSNNGSQLVAMVMPGAISGAIAITAGTTVSSATQFVVNPTLYPDIQVEAKLVGTPHDGQLTEEGNAVAVSADGNTVAIGAELDGYTFPNGKGQSGGVWIFVRNGAGWSSQAKLAAGQVNLGASVALSADGNTVIAGEPADNSGVGGGAVFIRTGKTWAQQTELIGTGYTDNPPFQGSSVAISADGNTAVVGGGANSHPGAVWVFTRSGTKWTQQGGVLIGSGAVGGAEQGAAVDISADGNTLAIGGPYDNNTAGAIWIFNRSGGIWNQVGSKLTGTGGSTIAHLGISVKLNADGTTLAAGGAGDGNGNGATWIFTQTGGTWSQQGPKLIGGGATSNSGQGGSVGISADGNTIAIGGGSDNNGNGATWIFTRQSGTWSQQGSKLTGTGAVGLAGFGKSVALSLNGNFMAAGGENDDSGVGATWMFESQLSAAMLSSLLVSHGSLSPVFSGPVTSYTDKVVSNVDSIKITPTAAQAGSTITVNGSAVASGAASQSIHLAPGSNTISIVVTALGGIATETYTINVIRLSGNTNLSGLAFSNCTLSPAFSTGNTSYTAYLHSGSTSTAVTPTATDPTATITVNGTTVASGTASAPISFGANPTPVTIIVTSGDGVTTKTYQVNITNATSANDDLSALSISAGLLTPAFKAATTAYNVSVNNTVNTISITPTAADPTAAITVNGSATNSGVASAPDSLKAGLNAIAVVVTAQDGSTKTYTINVTRAAASNDNLIQLVLADAVLSPAFSGPVSSYTATMPLGLTTTTVTPTAADPGATITVNGTAVSSGAASATITLGTDPTPVNIVVTAANGVTVKTYSVNVVHAISTNDNLSALAISAGLITPAFKPTTTTYNVTVNNITTSIAITPTTADPTATVTVNGVAVTSGSASAGISLNIGLNVIPVVVTAQDGTTMQTYTVNVTRTMPSNDNLVGITLSSGYLSTVFVNTDTTYTANVPLSLSAITVTPIPAMPGETITVNGVAASGPITLNPVPGSISIVVVAPNGITTKTYTITLFQQVSADNNLSALSISSGALTPSFNKFVDSYAVTVNNDVSSVSVTPAAEDTTSRITVNGIPVASGTASGPISLKMGTNLIIVAVTAQNGTVQNYDMAVNRVPGSNDNLLSLTLSAGTLSPVFQNTVLNYLDNVPDSVSSISITPTVADPSATISFGGSPIPSGVAFGPNALSVGDNQFQFLVTAANGSTSQTYVVDVVRAAGGADAFVPIGVTEPFNTPVLANDGIMIHKGVSPNGDGIADFLRIDNITQYPDNHLMIMTRNGQVIYDVKGYDNSTKVFDGHSNKTGRMQLPGTYFYALDYAVKGIVKHITGFLVLKY